MNLKSLKKYIEEKFKTKENSEVLSPLREERGIDELEELNCYDEFFDDEKDF